IRGEHLFISSSFMAICGSPPHTRGPHRPTIPAGDNARITPAYAGSTPPGPWRCQRGSDHPRVRGEHDGSAGPPEVVAGSPPRARGAPVRVEPLQAGRRVIPACAGSTGARPGRALPARDQPRVRGEHDPWNGTLRTIFG